MAGCIPGPCCPPLYASTGSPTPITFKKDLERAQRFFRSSAQQNETAARKQQLSEADRDSVPFGRSQSHNPDQRKPPRALQQHL